MCAVVSIVSKFTIKTVASQLLPKPTNRVREQLTEGKAVEKKGLAIQHALGNAQVEPPPSIKKPKPRLTTVAGVISVEGIKCRIKSAL